MSEQEPERAKERRLTRDDVVEVLRRGGSLERAVIVDVVLAGLELRGRSFRGADVRGLRLYDEADPETRSDIRETDWTDAEIGDVGSETLFVGVDATGATFGFTEPLVDRRARHEREGGTPKAGDSGSIANFNGSNGDFVRTTWKHVDFGGGTGYDAIFAGADLSGSVIEGSDLKDADLSQAKLEGAIIKDPVALDGLRIREADAESVALGIALSDASAQGRFKALVSEKGAVSALKEAFGVEAVPEAGSKETGRERHEKAANEVIDRLRGEGYFREGETAVIVPATDGQAKSWVARCDADVLLDAPLDPEWKKRFPAADPLHDAFVAAGYRVDVWPDYESGDAATFRVEYHLYEKE